MKKKIFILTALVMSASIASVTPLMLGKSTQEKLIERENQIEIAETINTSFKRKLEISTLLETNINLNSDEISSLEKELNDESEMGLLDDYLVVTEQNTIELQLTQTLLNNLDYEVVHYLNSEINIANELMTNSLTREINIDSIPTLLNNPFLRQTSRGWIFTTYFISLPIDIALFFITLTMQALRAIWFVGKKLALKFFYSMITTIVNFSIHIITTLTPLKIQSSSVMKLITDMSNVPTSVGTFVAFVFDALDRKIDGWVSFWG